MITPTRKNMSILFKGMSRDDFFEKFFCILSTNNQANHVEKKDACLKKNQCSNDYMDARPRTRSVTFSYFFFKH